MKYDGHDPSAVVAHPDPRYPPYSSASSYASSSSSASLWSDAASQSSDDTSFSASTSDSDSCDSFCLSKRATSTAQNVVNSRRSLHQHEPETAVPAELRQNPRRSAPGSHPGRSALPPALVRQSDRKVNFVDALVDTSTHIVTAFWPLSSAVCGNELGDKAVLPLRTFIQETLRRSRTSYSTLQVALYYLVLIRPHVPKQNSPTAQPADDRHADRALQCGRRMFLAALILACKYLQDRNYSARAWSKISGLNTQEINQNEIAFLFAVKWKLHITEEAFQRFTRLIHKSRTYPQQHAEWKEIALKLEANITSHESLFPNPRTSTSTFTSTTSDLCALSPRSILNLPQPGSRCSPASDRFTATLLPAPAASVYDPLFTEPMPKTIRPSDRLAPISIPSHLPSPRPTPQSVGAGGGFCTPAASAVSRIFGKSTAMGLAMAQAGSAVGTCQANLDRFTCSSVRSSPSLYYPGRRSSLAHSISSASSPESMVTDLARSSRSSSISSASSLGSATFYNSNRGSVPLRSRGGMRWNDRMSSKPSVPSVPEDVDEKCTVSPSPGSYGSETKLGGLTLNTPPVTRGFSGRDRMACDAASDAARALQDLHKHDAPCHAAPLTAPSRKRHRPGSVDPNESLHDNVRELLTRRYDADAAEPSWPDTMVTRPPRMHGVTYDACLPAPGHAAFGPTVKRVCCSTEAASGYQVTGGVHVHPAVGLGGRRIWDSILNN
ncbi:hypothetical protein E4U53_006103 [Claviceps sorghi]|nr:hypothetical protein E4U53_006103 [Claviceps sorghi]